MTRELCKDMKYSWGKWLSKRSNTISGYGSWESMACCDHPSPTTKDLRVFAGTWNVGGRVPKDGINLRLREWLMKLQSTPDIYVLGFQEMVPLNATNVLCPDDKGPANKWMSLIGDSLYDQTHGSTYRLVSSKQMVGIFLCVWVRAELVVQLGSVRVSSVGTGIMGYLGNKGSVAISMELDHTTLCFVCTHLASGEREGDQLRRNSDVMEILKRTKFLGQGPGPVSPTGILEHDRIIWLGDLNYRLSTVAPEEASIGCSGGTPELLKKGEWESLLHEDQLGMEQKAGRVLIGWKEGRISFPPTYKYLVDSDQYAFKRSPNPEPGAEPQLGVTVYYGEGRGCDSCATREGSHASPITDPCIHFSAYRLKVATLWWSAWMLRGRRARAMAARLATVVT